MRTPLHELRAREVAAGPCAVVPGGVAAGRCVAGAEGTREAAACRVAGADPAGGVRMTVVFAESLRRWREGRSLKQVAAAVEMGVSPALWGHWERGRRFPSGEMLGVLLRYTGLTPGQLLCPLAGRGCPAAASCPRLRHRAGEDGGAAVASTE